MPDISSIGHGSVGPVHRTGGAPGGGSEGGTPRMRPAEDRLSDRVELSTHARLLDRLRAMPDVRSDRVDAVQEAIQSGAYETDSKMEVAVSRLLEDLFA